MGCNAVVSSAWLLFLLVPALLNVPPKRRALNYRTTLHGHRHESIKSNNRLLLSVEHVRSPPSLKKPTVM
jgi:hypothetical protein